MSAKTPFLLVLGAALLPMVSCQTKVSSENAQRLENQGAYEQALQQYAELLLSSAAIVKTPDLNECGNLALAGEWKGKVAAYVAATVAPPESTSSALPALLQAVGRCTTHVQRITSTTPWSPKPLKADSVPELWRTAFFQAAMALPAGYEPLMAAADSAALSFVRMNSTRSYAYEGAFVEVATGKAVSFDLYWDATKLVLLRPGRHLLVCRALARFSSGGTWKSPYSVLALDVPAEPSLVSFTLRTKVETKQ